MNYLFKCVKNNSEKLQDSLNKSTTDDSLGHHPYDTGQHGGKN